MLEKLESWKAGKLESWKAGKAGEDMEKMEKTWERHGAHTSVGLALRRWPRAEVP